MTATSPHTPSKNNIVVDGWRHLTSIFQKTKILDHHILSSAWAPQWEPINEFLNESDPRQRETLTIRWRDNMIWQLNTILITSSIVSSLISSSFSWPHFDPSNDGNACIRLTKTAWYCALVLAICSVGSAAHQLVALFRLSSFSNHQAAKIICAMLKNGPAEPTPGPSTANIDTPESRCRLSIVQDYLWSIPVMLLNVSLYLFTGGLCIIVYWDVGRAFPVLSGWSAVGMAAAFTLGMAGSSANYLISSVGLYYGIGTARKRVDIHSEAS